MIVQTLNVCTFYFDNSFRRIYTINLHTCMLGNPLIDMSIYNQYFGGSKARFRFVAAKTRILGLIGICRNDLNNLPCVKLNLLVLNTT